MSHVERIRNATLQAAVRQLASEPEAQDHPLLLLYLQNLTDAVAALRAAVCRTDTDNLALSRRLAAMERSHHEV